MTVELWVGQDFETTHERTALAKFLSDMRERFESSKDRYFVLANFYLDGSQVDLAVVKNKAIIVIEIKECADPFRATENGDWTTMPGNTIIGTGGENPFEQVKQYRSRWMNYLRKNQGNFLTPSKINHVRFEYISAIVCVSPRIHPKTENNIDSSVVWFSLTGLDQLSQAIYQRTSIDIDLSDDEIMRLISFLNLRKGDLVLGKPLENQDITIKLPPFASDKFVGRKEQLEYLGKLLLQRHAKIAVIMGSPGTGKTTLARAFAHSASREFSDGIYWVSAQDSDTQTVIRKLAEEIEGGVISESTLTQPWDIWNRYVSNKNILAIIDNVDDLDFCSFHPSGEQCKIILTTRNRLIPQYLGLPDDCIVDLKPFDNTESMILMQKILAREISGTDLNWVKEICESLGNLPLGVFLAGSYMRVYKTPIDEYAQKMRDEKKRLTSLTPRVGMHGMDIELVFGLSLNSIPQNLVALFASLGVCRSNGFTIELATAIGSNIVKDVEHGVNTLYGISLINQLSPERYFFQPLLRDYARKLASDKNLIKQAEARYYGWYEDLINKYPVHEEDLEKKHTTREESDKVKYKNLKLLGMELDGLIATAEWKLSSQDADLVVWYGYWRNLREVLDTRGFTDRAIEILKTAVEISNKNIELSSEQGVSGSTVNDIRMKAYYLAQLGKFYDRARKSEEALRMFDEALKIEKNEDRIGKVKNSRGVAIRHMRRFKQAIEQLRESLKITEKMGIGSTLYSLNSLARALIDSGDSQEALIYLERALKMEATRPTDLGSLSITLSETGRAHKRLGNYQKALDSFKKAMELTEAESNPRSFSILCNEIGDVLGLMGLYQDAIQYFKKAFLIAESIHDPRNINITQRRFLKTLEFIIKKMKELKHERNWKDALPLATIWLDAEKTLGKAIHEFWALIDYGDIVSRTDDIAGALNAYDLALKNATIRKDMKGQSIAHQCKARSLRSLGDEENKQIALSELRIAEAIEINLSLDKMQISRILLDKAGILMQVGNKDLAARCSESALVYTPDDARALDSISRSKGNKKHVSGLIVGQRGTLKKFFSKKNENKYFGFIRLQDSKEVYFSSSAYEENWETLRENLDVFVDYFETEENGKKGNRVGSIATRVILAEQKKKELRNG